jgi:FKBP-type peptidyl-prolyl cis-trans isomerase
LEYIDIAVGTGRTATLDDPITIDLTGWLTNGTRFEETSTSGQHRVLRLSDAEVIPGWRIGIAGMKEGGRRRLIIPSDLAYGPKGRPPKIPPYATLIYDIDLLAVG